MNASESSNLPHISSIKVTRMYRPYLYHDPMSSSAAAIKGDCHPQAQLNGTHEMHCSRLHRRAEAERRIAEANPEAEAHATGAESLLLPWSLLARPSRRKKRLWCSHRVV